MQRIDESPTVLPHRRLEILIASFLDHISVRSCETRGTYQRSLRQFVRWTEKDGSFGFVTRDVERFKNYLIDKRGLSDASVSTYLTALRQLCKYLVERGILHSNPARFVRGRQRPTTHSRSALSYNEVRTLLDSVDRSSLRGIRDYAMIKTMLGCGLSEIEMVRANVGDIGHENGQWILRVQGKGRERKEDIVVLSDDVKREIDAYLAAREISGSEEPLFLSAGNKVRGKRMSTRGIRERINYYLRHAGIKGNRDRRVTPYSLRHTAALLMADSGASVEEIRRRMRLGSIATAMLYVQRGNGDYEIVK